MEKEVIICLDIGGTNCRVGLVSRDGQLLEHHTLSTQSLAQKGFMTALGRHLLQYRRQLDGHCRVRAVSLGFPAALDRSRRHVLSAPNIPGLPEELPVCDLLEEALGLPVFLERDVDMQLAHDMRELGLDRSGFTVGIYFGTGIGNSIFLEGKPLKGAHGVAGELGHIPRLGQTTLCGCGNLCCIEPLGGGRRLTELCETEFAGTPIPEIYLRHGSSEQLRQQIEVMAAAVATEVNILDPEHVVLGGGLLQMEGFPLAYLEERIFFHTRKPYPLKGLKLLYARSGQCSGIIGAGLLAWERLDTCGQKA